MIRQDEWMYLDGKERWLGLGIGGYVDIIHLAFAFAFAFFLALICPRE